MDGTILIADDDQTIRTVLTQAFTRAGCKVHATSSLSTLLRWVREGQGDLVISDVMMPDGNGLEMLPEIFASRPDMPVIVISARNNIMTAIQAAEAEAFDYLPKPFDLPDLMKRANRALSAKAGSSKKRDERTWIDDDLPMVGKTDVMQKLYKLVSHVMNTELPVLITGESGAGKSLIARAIHDFSDRRDQPFVVSSGSEFSFPDQGADLLRHVGAGTLVFDEVGDFTPAAQSQAVRMLDSISDAGPRIITTTQINLSQKMATGDFRNDLYYRLSGVTVAAPPLRERVDDIPILVEYFLARGHRDGETTQSFSPESLAILRKFAWPGNVRQLEHVIQRIVATSTEAEISSEVVEIALKSQPSIQPFSDTTSDERLSESVGSHLRRYFDLHGDNLPQAGLYSRILREIELPLIEIALDASGGNQAKCAELLGINRNTLRKKINELDIRVTRRRKLM